MSPLLESAMSRMSSLYRLDGETVPSWPLESIRTGIAFATPVVTPRMPSMKALVCGPPPIRDSVRLGRNARVTDKDIGTTGRNTGPGIVTECDVIGSGGVVLERVLPTGGVAVARGVVRERI